MSKLSVPQLRAFCREHHITEAQADILRKAARKYDNYIDGALFDGTINTYGVRDDTLRALRASGLIAEVYKIESQHTRDSITDQYESIIREAFLLAQQDPFSVEESTFCVVWRAVSLDLQRARGLQESLTHRTLRITDAGRKLAAKWKEALGATEP